MLKTETQSNSWVWQSDAAATRLDSAVAELLGSSRASASSMIKSGLVAVNRKVVTRPAHLVKSADEVNANLAAYAMDNAKTNPTPPFPPILYEDEHLLVIDKPAGLVVHHGHGNRSGTLVEAIASHLPSSALGAAQRHGIVHRLDKNTSGALILARTEPAYLALTAAIAARRVSRTYLALVTGHVTPPNGVIDAPLSRSRTAFTKRAVDKDGKAAQTIYRTIRRYGDLTLLRATLVTGRTHQIRVHLSAMGYPVYGDALYSRAKAAKAAKSPARHFLHAAEVSFKHPITGAEVTAKSPLPPELQTILDNHGG